MKQTDIIEQGKRRTQTYFLNDNKDEFKIDVWIEDDYRCNALWYEYRVSLRKFRCSKFILLKDGHDEVTKQIIYQAFKNHHDTINPITYFGNGTTAGEITSFNVVDEKEEKIYRERYKRINQ